MKKEVLKACKDNNLYAFIASNYWNMSKEELKDICLELDYALYKNGHKDDVIVDDLKDRWEDELNASE